MKTGVMLFLISVFLLGTCFAAQQSWNTDNKRDISKMKKPQGEEAVIFKALLEQESIKWIPHKAYILKMELTDIGIIGRENCINTPAKGFYTYVIAQLEWSGDCYECLACFLKTEDGYELTGAIQTNTWRSI
jgi:hypothetical protein